MDQKNPGRQDIQLPPGFRFHPSDEELIVHYLRKKATKTPLPASIVAEVELYKFNPWDLPKKSVFGDEEWYFFTPRDRKYPNGMRPNRMAASGYWKATGIDKPILTSCGSKVIGVKKALVFYTGRPPKGNKTDWIMHEYRLPEPDVPWSAKKEKSMRLDEWVLCRVRQKTGMPFGNLWEDRNGSNEAQQYQYPSSKAQLDKQYCSPTTEITSPRPPNLEMVMRQYCPMLPFLFGTNNNTRQEFPAAAMDSAVSSSISFEGGNNYKSSAAGTASSSVSEDNFNIEYLQNSAASNVAMRKRKLLIFDEAAAGNTHENFTSPQPSKKEITIPGDYQNHQVPISSATVNDHNVLDDNGMIIYYNNTANHSDKNNAVYNINVDQLGPAVMYQDLYTLAFA